MHLKGAAAGFAVASGLYACGHEARDGVGTTHGTRPQVQDPPSESTSAAPTSSDSAGELPNGFTAIDESCGITRELSLPGEMPIDDFDASVVKLGARFAVLHERHALFSTLLGVEEEADYCESCNGLGVVGVLSADDKPSLMYVGSGAEAFTAYSWQPGQAAAAAPVDLFPSQNSALVTSFDLATSRDGYRVIVAEGDRVVTPRLNIAVLDSDAQLLAPALVLEMDSDYWEMPKVVPTLRGAVVSVTAESADGADILWYLRGVDENGAETLSTKVTVPDASARGFSAPYAVVTDGYLLYAFWKNSQDEQLAMHVRITGTEAPEVIDPWVAPTGIARISEARFIAQTVEPPLVVISSVSLDGTAQHELFTLSDDSQYSTQPLIAAERQVYYVTQIVGGKRLIREVACNGIAPQ